VFVLLDNDGEADAKRKLLNLDDRRSHVWREKELESYLLIPSALSSISGKPIEEVEETINATAGSGKQKLDSVLRSLGIPDVGKATIVTNAVRAKQVPQEFQDLVGKVRTILGEQ
jgi:hypothetical protein